MLSQENNLKKFSLWFVIIALGVLVFFLIKPVILSVIGGLFLAYIFSPAYSRLVRMTKNKTLSAFVISFLIILIILIPVWFLVPVMLQQVFGIFSASQNINIGGLLATLFPTSSPQFLAQMSVAVSSFIGKITSYALEYLNSVFLDIPLLSLHLVVVFFVFFYALRDSEGLRRFVSELSPFTKSKEKMIVEQFESVTDSVIYGQVIVGLVQGGLAGLGLLIFGVDNVLILTILAIFLSILPILGPFIIWIPVAIYFFTSGQTSTGVAYILYNLIIVSTVDNILRTHLVSRKTNLSPAVVLVSMIGGVLIFGVLGLFLGPLIVSYFVMFLQAYKSKNLHLLINETKDQ